MKKLSIYFILLICASFMFAACSEDKPDREPSPSPNSSSTIAYFENAINSFTIEKDATQVEVDILREKTTSAQTVKITAEGKDKEYFDAPAEVSFAAGEAKKTITVKVANNIDLMKKYSLTLALDPDQASPYKGFATAQVDVTKEDFEPIGEGTYNSSFFSASWPVDVEYSPATNSYRIKDCIVNNFDFDFTVEEGDVITFATRQETGEVDPTYGMIYFDVPGDGSESYLEGRDAHVFIQWGIPDGRFFGVSEEIINLPALPVTP